MDFEQELKKFELSSVFTINFSWLKQYVESRNGIYTPIRNISDDDFREIESSFYALQAAWKAWREAKDQAVQSKQDLLDRVNARWQLAHEQCAENWNTYSSAQMDAFDWVEQDIEEFLGEAQEPAND